ncbi:hypothetical protein D3C75_694210 [compost metagenome]
MPLAFDVSVRSRTKAVIVLIVPVRNIVAALHARFGEVADLVLGIAGRLHSGHQQQVHLQLILFTWQRELILVKQRVEKRILFHLQAVDRIMRQVQLQRLADALSKHIHGLVGQSEHEINRQVMQPYTAGILQAAVDVVYVVNPSDAA